MSKEDDKKKIKDFPLPSREAFPSTTNIYRAQDALLITVGAETDYESRKELSFEREENSNSIPFVRDNELAALFLLLAAWLIVYYPLVLLERDSLGISSWGAFGFFFIILWSMGFFFGLMFLAYSSRTIKKKRKERELKKLGLEKK